MKKLLFAVVAVAALTFASCGNKSKTNAEAPVDSAMLDTASLSSETKVIFKTLSLQLTSALDGNDVEGVSKALANLAAMYKTLANSGNLTDMRIYGRLAQNLVDEHSDAINSIGDENETVSKLYSCIKDLPVSDDATLEDAKDAVSDEAVNLASESFQKGALAGATAEAAAEALGNAATNAKNAAVDAADNAVDNAKEGLNEAKENVNEATKKASEDVEEAAKNAKEGLDKATKKAGNAIDNAADKVKDQFK
ncbi:MAG: hypothetical protein ACOYJK_02790 [Prevotella sp.]|jgi:hypothetical protein